MRYLTLILAALFAVALNTAPVMADSDRGYDKKSERHAGKYAKRDHGSDDQSRVRRDHGSRDAHDRDAHHAKTQAEKNREAYAERMRRIAEKRNRPTSR